MKFLSNVKFFVLALIAVLLAVACSPEATSPSTDAAVATADGSGGDNGIGGSDSSMTDTGKDSTADQDVNNPDVGTDTGGGTDAAVLICNNDEEIVVFKDWQSACFSKTEEEALVLLDTHTAVPATMCASFGDSDYCLADFKLEPPNELGDCFQVTLWYPQNLKVKYTFTFDWCDSLTKICTHEKSAANGDSVKIVLDINKKLFSSHWTAGTSEYDENYKLIKK